MVTAGLSPGTSNGDSARPAGQDVLQRFIDAEHYVVFSAVAQAAVDIVSAQEQQRVKVEKEERRHDRQHRQYHLNESKPGTPEIATLSEMVDANVSNTDYWHTVVADLGDGPSVQAR